MNRSTGNGRGHIRVATCPVNRLPNAAEATYPLNGVTEMNRSQGLIDKDYAILISIELAEIACVRALPDISRGGYDIAQSEEEERRKRNAG